MMMGHRAVIHTYVLDYLPMMLAILPAFIAGQKNCTEREYFDCSRGLPFSILDNDPLIPPQYVKFLDPQENCRTRFSEVIRCTQDVKSACQNPQDPIILGIDAYTTALQYFCGREVYPEYLKYGPCIHSNNSVRDVNTCELRRLLEIRENKPTLDLCSNANRFRACVSIALDALCGSGAASLFDRMYGHAYGPVYADLLPGCDLTGSLFNYCYPIPCINGGTCSSPSGQPICACQPDYWGDFCENSNISTTAKSLNNPDNGSTGLSTPAVIGIVIGVIGAGLLGICLTLVFLCRYLKLMDSDQGQAAVAPQPPNPAGSTSPDVVLASRPLPYTPEHNLGPIPHGYLDTADDPYSEIAPQMHGYCEVRDIGADMKVLWSGEKADKSNEDEYLEVIDGP